MVDVECIKPFPCDVEAEKHEDHDNSQLPLHANHQHLQRNHKKDCIEVIKDGKYACLVEDPGLFEPCSRKHGKKDTGRSRCCKSAQQQEAKEESASQLIPKAGTMRIELFSSCVVNKLTKFAFKS